MTEWKRVTKATNVREGAIHLAFMGLKKVALSRCDGVLVAFNNACPHAGAPLSAGGIKHGVVTCSRHRWTFNAVSGACSTNPMYALRKYEARERDGWVELLEPTEIW